MEINVLENGISISGLASLDMIKRKLMMPLNNSLSWAELGRKLAFLKSWWTAVIVATNTILLKINISIRHNSDSNSNLNEVGDPSLTKSLLLPVVKSCLFFFHSTLFLSTGKSASVGPFFREHGKSSLILDREKIGVEQNGAEMNHNRPDYIFAIGDQNHRDDRL
jgi:hypothetical protein